MDFVPANADARRHALIRLSSAVIFLALLLPANARADGGALQFTKEAGPFTVTMFSAPVPLRVGACDLSVMVQRSSDGVAVLDGQIDLVFSQPGSEIKSAATRGNATNKLLYAANVDFPASGQWNIKVQITRGAETGLATGELTVAEPQERAVAYWPYFTPVPLAIILFVLNQWLKRQRSLSVRQKPLKREGSTRQDRSE